MSGIHKELKGILHFADEIKPSVGLPNIHTTMGNLVSLLLVITGKFPAHLMISHSIAGVTP